MYEFIVLHLYCKFKQHLHLLTKIFGLFYVKWLPSVWGKSSQHIGKALFLCLYRRKSWAPLRDLSLSVVCGILTSKAVWNRGKIMRLFIEQSASTAEGRCTWRRFRSLMIVKRCAIGCFLVESWWSSILTMWNWVWMSTNHAAKAFDQNRDPNADMHD